MEEEHQPVYLDVDGILKDLDLAATQPELAQRILDLSAGGSAEDLAAKISSRLVGR